MPRGLTSQQIADKWASRLGSATAEMTAGVNAVTTNPAEKAAAAAQRWADGVNRALADGSFRRGCQRTTLQSWQHAFITKGIPRIAAGTAVAKPKMVALMDQMRPYQQNVLQQLDQTNPRGDKAANLQRMMVFAQKMLEFKMA